MRIALFGMGGKVGSTLAPALERAGHELVDGRSRGPEGCDVAVDFTRPDAVLENAERCFAAGVPVVVVSGSPLDTIDGVHRWLEKAGDPELVIRTIEEVIGH